MDEKSKKALLERVNQVNKKEENITFKVEFEGSILHEVKIPIAPYAKDVLENNPADLYYFFKDTTAKLEEILAEKHKELIWKEMGK